MTNREYFATCKKEDLAMSLTQMIVIVIEEITHKKVPDALFALEYNSIMKYLDSEFIEPSRYLN